MPLKFQILQVIRLLPFHWKNESCIMWNGNNTPNIFLNKNQIIEIGIPDNFLLYISIFNLIWLILCLRKGIDFMNWILIKITKIYSFCMTFINWYCRKGIGIKWQEELKTGFTLSAKINSFLFLVFSFFSFGFYEKQMHIYLSVIKSQIKKGDIQTKKK